MSDDEDYYDEYDDEDIFWIDEPDPDMADDLAGTSTYDPAFQGDPSLEAVEFFSDWDDLSDDYYDEDPTAVRRLRAMGWLHNTTPQDQKSSSPPTKRRKPSTGKELKPDLTSFQSVVWKNPTDEIEIVQLYAPGDGEKVALLKNWREVFKNSKPAIGRFHMRAPGSVPLDQEMGVFIRPGKDGEAGLGLDGNVESSFIDDSVMEEENSLVTNNDVPTSPPTTNSLRSNSLHALSETSLSSEPVVHESLSNPNGTQTKKPTKEPTETPTNVPSLRNRKRKASVSLDDEQPDAHENNGPAASKPRSKRTASAKVRDTAERPAESSAAVRRSARTKK